MVEGDTAFVRVTGGAVSQGTPAQLHWDAYEGCGTLPQLLDPDGTPLLSVLRYRGMWFSCKNDCSHHDT